MAEQEMRTPLESKQALKLVALLVEAVALTLVEVVALTLVEAVALTLVEAVALTLVEAVALTLVEAVALTLVEAVAPTLVEAATSQGKADQTRSLPFLLPMAPVGLERSRRHRAALQDLEVRPS